MIVHYFVGTQSEQYEDAALSVLSRSEARRYSACRDRNQRRRRVITRALLRVLTGYVTAIEPASVKIVATEYGKPVLVSDDLRFSVSHSVDCCGIALATGCEVGVDLEYCQDLSDAGPVAKIMMSRDELRHWLKLPFTERKRALYQMWTRKEAFLKCIGVGIRGGLRGVPRDYCTPVIVRNSEWSVKIGFFNIVSHPNYSAALAVGARIDNPKMYEDHFTVRGKTTQPSRRRLSAAGISTATKCGYVFIDGRHVPILRASNTEAV